jgi:NADH dehydrogenase
VITDTKHIKIDRMNMIQVYENIHTIVDIAFMETPKYPKTILRLPTWLLIRGKTLQRILKQFGVGINKLSMNP